MKATARRTTITGGIRTTTGSESLRRGSRIPAFGAAFFAVFLIFGALRGLADVVYFSEVARVADRLENGASLAPDAVSRVASMRALEDAERSCAMARAAVTLRLAVVDATPRGRDVARDDAALDAAAAAIAHALRCFPLDGNLWLRSAMVANAVAGPGTQVVSALSMSSWTAPGEAWVLRQRLRFAASLHDAGLEEVRVLLRADIRNGVRQLPPDEIARFYESAGEQTRLLYREILPFAAPPRRERMEALFDATDRNAAGGSSR